MDMKKLLSLILGLILFSGAAYAGVHWLPDYLGDNLNRGNDDYSNHGYVCPGGRFTAPKDGTRYSCRKDDVIEKRDHLICYICEPLNCASGYSTKYQSIDNCGNTTNKSGWKYSYKGYSGELKCGLCEKNTCDTNRYKETVSKCGTTGSLGWTLDTTTAGNYCYSGDDLYGTCKTKQCDTNKYKETVSQCGTTGSLGWTLDKTSSGSYCYSGDKLYGTCKALSCNSPYLSGVTTCGSGYSRLVDKTRYNGNTECAYCNPLNCPSDQKTQKDCYSQTNGSNGWKWTGTTSYTGETQCGYCKENTCTNTYQTTAASCQTTGASGWTLSSTDKCYAGAKTLYKCVAKACQVGTIQAAANCASNATWTANSYYSGNNRCGTCIVSSCPQNYSTSIQDVKNCGTTGSSGWTLSKNGTLNGVSCTRCVKKQCPYGFTAGITASSCGSNEDYEQSTTYYGNDVCGKCVARTCKTTVASGDYDAFIESFSDLQSAISNGKTNLYIAKNLTISGSITFNKNVTLYDLSRYISKAECSSYNSAPSIIVNNGATLATSTSSINVSLEFSTTITNKGTIELKGKLNLPYDKGLTIQGDTGSTSSASTYVNNIVVNGGSTGSGLTLIPIYNDISIGNISNTNSYSSFNISIREIKNSRLSISGLASNGIITVPSNPLTIGSGSSISIPLPQKGQTTSQCFNISSGTLTIGGSSYYSGKKCISCSSSSCQVTNQ